MLNMSNVLLLLQKKANKGTNSCLYHAKSARYSAYSNSSTTADQTVISPYHLSYPQMFGNNHVSLPLINIHSILGKDRMMLQLLLLAHQLPRVLNLLFQAQ